MVNGRGRTILFSYGFKTRKRSKIASFLLTDNNTFSDRSVTEKQVWYDWFFPAVFYEIAGVCNVTFSESVALSAESTLICECDVVFTTGISIRGKHLQPHPCHKNVMLGRVAK